MSPAAARHCSPNTYVTRSDANRASPTPKGTAHMRTRRLDLEKASKSLSRWSTAAQTAGYIACDTTRSAASANEAIAVAKVSAPIPATPTTCSPTITVPWMSTSVDRPSPNSGQENDQYSRAVERLQRSRSGYGDVARATTAAPPAPTMVPITSDQ